MYTTINTDNYGYHLIIHYYAWLHQSKLLAFTPHLLQSSKMGCMKLFNSCFKAILFITWKKVIRFFITAIISLACLAFVLHQTYECIQEYFRYPQSTQISYDSKKNHIQPVIIICPKNQLVFEEVFYKKSVLQDCNLRYVLAEFHLGLVFI